MGLPSYSVRPWSLLYLTLSHHSNQPTPPVDQLDMLVEATSHQPQPRPEIVTAYSSYHDSILVSW